MGVLQNINTFTVSLYCESYIHCSFTFNLNDGCLIKVNYRTNTIRENNRCVYYHRQQCWTVAPVGTHLKGKEINVLFIEGRA